MTMTVETLIGNLLLQHNCVVVPGFGGFVAQRTPARLDEASAIMRPPGKSVLFNKQLIANDGLLIQAYAVHSNIHFTAAEVEVRNCVSVWDKQLQQGHRVQIDRVGILYLDNERNICFEQDRFYNLLMESYGLGAIHFVTVEDVQALNTHERIQTLTQPQAETTTEAPVIALAGNPIPVLEAVKEEHTIAPLKKKKTPYLKYAAAACTLPILFYSFWIPMKTDVLESGVLTFGDFNPFHQQQEGSYRPAKEKYSAVFAAKRERVTLPENISVYSYQLDEDTYIPVKVKEGTTVSAPETPVSAPVQPATSGHSGWVIVGSYSTRENAQKQVDLIQSLGFHGEILERDGKIRVSAGNGSQFGTLKQKLAAHGIEAWLLD